MAARLRSGGRAKAWFDAAIGWTAVGLLRLLRLPNRKRMSNLLGRMMRAVGPWFPEHKIGRVPIIRNRTDTES